jgi:hypothetical protein
MAFDAALPRASGTRVAIANEESFIRPPQIGFALAIILWCSEPRLLLGSIGDAIDVVQAMVATF